MANTTVCKTSRTMVDRNRFPVRCRMTSGTLQHIMVRGCFPSMTGAAIGQPGCSMVHLGDRLPFNSSMTSGELRVEVIGRCPSTMASAAV
ncbi:MAG TPA: hypothetical protein VIO61_03710 [Anaerolineaceae bacterium]